MSSLYLNYALCMKGFNSCQIYADWGVIAHLVFDLFSLLFWCSVSDISIISQDALRVTIFVFALLLFCSVFDPSGGEKGEDGHQC